MEVKTYIVGHVRIRKLSVQVAFKKFLQENEKNTTRKKTPCLIIVCEISENLSVSIAHKIHASL